ncbi:hypothetical protein T09_13865 [Trichinella sp. T9]|nr:hypothetical protein T09_13865 [Trichinella sp. T9]
MAFMGNGATFNENPMREFANAALQIGLVQMDQGHVDALHAASLFTTDHDAILDQRDQTFSQCEALHQLGD